ncbi:MAG: flagellar assembly protein T N-terminal domain-containing protein [Calditerrivibrio sp.]|nr:flagellar assembly protein T N-terminal domain-containing protein [Calditerrivibrio sp.]MCA1980121.1 flagellar assembly protein T N-terminal domain-containing protein [Calditerrivibrio sp.]
MKKIVILFLLCIFPILTIAATKSVTATGEANIINNDVASAKFQAIARAKWAALEAAAGVQVKVETILQNATLVDEAIKSEVKGFVEDYKILDEGKDKDIYWVKISANISPVEAQKVVSIFAKNTSVAFYIPVIFPDKKVDETTALSEKVINELVGQGFDVVDIASLGNKYSLNEIDNALKNNNFSTFRNISYQFLSGAILIGKVDTTLSAGQGKNIGYGVSLPFNVVTGRLTYRLIGDKNGQKVIVASGYVSGRGQGPTPEDATHNMLENLASNVSNELISVVVEKIKGQNKRTVEVVLAGNNDLNKLLELKNDLQYISWVLSVNDKGIDKVVVEYPEKTIYLANAIKNLGKYNLKKFDMYRILIETSR